MENAIGRNMNEKNKKRRLSMLTNSLSSLSSTKTNKTDGTDMVDSSSKSLKRRLIDTDVDDIELAENTEPTPLSKKCSAVTPLTTLKRPYDTMMPPTPGLDAYNERLVFCNSFVYATCRDALNDEDIESELFCLRLIRVLEIFFFILK